MKLTSIWYLFSLKTNGQKLISKEAFFLLIDMFWLIDGISGRSAPEMELYFAMSVFDIAINSGYAIEIE